VRHPYIDSRRRRHRRCQMNQDGHPRTLQPFESGNLAAVKHGLWSDRYLADEIETERERLLELPWVGQVDELLIDEVARTRARIAAVDRDLDERGHFGRSGARSLLDHRARLGGHLLRCLDALGATPAARSKWAARLSFSERVERELRAIEEGRDGR